MLPPSNRTLFFIISSRDPSLSINNYSHNDINLKCQPIDVNEKVGIIFTNNKPSENEALVK